MPVHMVQGLGSSSTDILCTVGSWSRLDSISRGCGGVLLEAIELLKKPSLATGRLEWKTTSTRSQVAIASTLLLYRGGHSFLFVVAAREAANSVSSPWAPTSAFSCGPRPWLPS